MRSLILILILTAPALHAQDIIDRHTEPKVKGKSDPMYVTDDRTFLRRTFLDLTGILPPDNLADQWLDSTDPGKRTLLIESLMESDAFTHRWTKFFEDIFGSHRLFFEYPESRNAFQSWIRKHVEDENGVDQLFRELIAADGNASDTSSPAHFWFMPLEDDLYRLDFLDDQVSLITKTALGIKTECISCHDGAYHLENVNVGLATTTREQFWGMAAFLAKSFTYVPNEDYEDEGAFIRNMSLVDLDVSEPDLQNGFLFADYEFWEGEYRAQSQAGDGMRSPRNGGLVQPKYMFNGGTPQAGESRREALARMITEDRQFARNIVNRIWAHFFGEGFVNPVDEWDLGRIDDATALTNDSTVQARTPDLMEQLTDYFIDSGYQLKPLVRLIANSRLYQWDFSAAPEPARTSYWHGSFRTRRIDAEAYVDAFHRAIGMPQKYMVDGRLDAPVTSAWELPGTDSPSFDAIFEYNLATGDIEYFVTPESLGYADEDEYFFRQYMGMDMLYQLGRGDSFNGIPRNNKSDISTALLLMNNDLTNFWLWEPENFPRVRALLNDMDSGAKDRGDVVWDLSRRILFRDPTEAEVELFSNHFRRRDRARAISDILWAMMNHPDFLYK